MHECARNCCNYSSGLSTARIKYNTRDSSRLNRRFKVAEHSRLQKCEKGDEYVLSFQTQDISRALSSVFIFTIRYDYFRENYRKLTVRMMNEESHPPIVSAFATNKKIVKDNAP